MDGVARIEAARETLHFLPFNGHHWKQRLPFSSSLSNILPFWRLPPDTRSRSSLQAIVPDKAVFRLSLIELNRRDRGQIVLATARFLLRFSSLHLWSSLALYSLAVVLYRASP